MNIDYRIASFTDEELRSLSEIFRLYFGELTISDDKVLFTNNNILHDDRDSKDKPIPCSVSVSIFTDRYPYVVDVEESTCAILGGCGCPCNNFSETLEFVSYALERFKFERKAFVQLSLFDL